MRRLLITCALAVSLPGGTAGAQSRPTDFSGRWVLVLERRDAPYEPDTLEMTAARELVIRQTARSITIDHTAPPGALPEAGTFEFGSGGFVGGVPGRGQGPPTQGRWGVTFFGTQLMMSRSATSSVNDVQITVSRGAFWLLDERGRLVIEFREERTKERPRTATRIYVRPR